jgi:hypothetical protein
MKSEKVAWFMVNHSKVKQKKIISFSGQFPKILMSEVGRHLFCLFVIISVGSNAVAAYTGNNHACLRHKCFTDNDRDQQTYGSDWSGPGKILEMTGNGHNFFFQNVKTINAAVKTRAAVPEKLTIFFFLPNVVT